MLCALTHKYEPALRLNGVWGLMNMAFQVIMLLQASNFQNDQMNLLIGRAENQGPDNDNIGDRPGVQTRLGHRHSCCYENTG